MKKIIMLLIAIGFLTISYGQDDNKKLPSFAVSFGLTDFKTAVKLRSAGLAKVLQSKEWKKTKNMSPVMAFSYMQGLSNNFDLDVTVSGTFVDYPVPQKVLRGNDALLLEGTLTGNLKLLTDNNRFSPYLTAGLGASKYRGYYGAFFPIGAGLQLKIIDRTFLRINSQYRVPVTENVAYSLYHSLGISSNISKKKEVKPIEVPVIPPAAPVGKGKWLSNDKDEDGVPDEEDKCPDAKGLVSLMGCPDTDGDGIADPADNCPTVAGLAKYKGCPIPDTDKDGINDEADKCPSQPGVARYGGCPVPDTDGDGVNDEDDKCPAVPGPASNYGCPVIAKAVVDKINIAAKNIFFAPGSSKLLPKSFKSLNDVAKLMADDKSLMLDIDGHTDNTGKADMNQTLSEKRAAAVKTYLTGKGVEASRMTAEGHGQNEPVADNKTAAGKAKNRRVEMKARNY